MKIHSLQKKASFKVGLLPRFLLIEKPSCLELPLVDLYTIAAESLSLRDLLEGLLAPISSLLGFEVQVSRASLAIPTTQRWMGCCTLMPLTTIMKPGSTTKSGTINWSWAAGPVVKYRGRGLLGYWEPRKLPRARGGLGYEKEEVPALPGTSR